MEGIEDMKLLPSPLVLSRRPVELVRATDLDGNPSRRQPGRLEKAPGQCDACSASSDQMRGDHRGSGPVVPEDLPSESSRASSNLFRPIRADE